MASLQIVWRNPHPKNIRRRCRQLVCDPHRGLYVMEELISAKADSWICTSRLEVRSFPRNELRPESKPRNWTFGFGAIG